MATSIRLWMITNRPYCAEAPLEDVHVEEVAGLPAYNGVCLDVWIPTAYRRNPPGPSAWDVVRVSEAKAAEAGLDACPRWRRRGPPSPRPAEWRHVY